MNSIEKDFDSFETLALKIRLWFRSSTRWFLKPDAGIAFLTRELVISERVLNLLNWALAK